MFIFVLSLLFGFFLGILAFSLPKVDSGNVASWYYDDADDELRNKLPVAEVVGPFSVRPECEVCSKKQSRVSLIPIFGFFLAKLDWNGCCFKLHFKMLAIQVSTYCVVLTVIPDVISDLYFVPVFVLSCALIVASFIDYSHKYVPSVLLLIIFIASLGVISFGHSYHAEYHYLQSLGVFSFLSLLNLGRVRLGAADIIIISSFALFLELSVLIEVTYLAVIFAAIQFSLYKVVSREQNLLAFVPSLFLSFFIIVLCGLDFFQVVVDF